MVKLTERERILRTYRRQEMERIIPAMKEGGGYVFASDHSIPSSVSYENMKEIARLAHELGKY